MTPAYLIFTSGTSGAPKGVLHAQRAVWGRRPMYQGWYGIGPSDVMLHTGAFNWTYTLGTGLCDPFANAATSVVYTGDKDPAIWGNLIARPGCDDDGGRTRYIQADAADRVRAAAHPPARPDGGRGPGACPSESLAGGDGA